MTCDPWGKPLTVTDANGTDISANTTHIANINPLRYRGYYYDVETGLYYVSSRYYDPTTQRFVNADDVDLLGANNDFASYNLFAYCGNNPLSRKDVSGYAWETAFDIITLGMSVADVCINPTDPWAWAGLVGDALDLIPFVTGIGEVTRTIRVSAEVIDGLGDLSRASEFGIRSYASLRTLTKGTGLHAHHIIEKRLLKDLYDRWGYSLDDILSVAVTPTEHQKFTNAWRDAFAYGKDYSNLTMKEIWEEAQKVYKDYPDLLAAAYEVLFK